jgi:hypothetical protein
MWQAELFIHGRLGLSARGAMSALTIANYCGGITGGLVTFGMAHRPHKGRQVVYATLLCTTYITRAASVLSAFVLTEW